ncbi:hypothetical protein FLO80_21450 [Aquicoccus porphyridii]|uniref:MAE-28990/MAE-18760-like HEPN domain-containing protein n=1 Tax=Aquicoccus porphyridii TaxID=1852029 RepID=A0A5A9YX61_9RHOB|nr:hypothetical protein [Aquicoccus porphyridii]KAA0909478.1 hypothetical protein FLO80_21450 [Aquicoccus porphyridii]
MWKAMLNSVKDEGVFDNNELGLFKWYADETEKVIKEMQKEELRWIQEQEGAGAAFSDVDDGGLIPVEYYSDRMRYSHVIYLTTLLERYLASASGRLNAILDRSLVFQPNDLQGDKWDKHRKFLEKYGQCKFPSDAWKALRTLIFVRNILVHENGDASSIKKNDLDRIKKCPGLDVAHGEVIVKYAYIEHCLSSFGYFVKHIERLIEQSYERGDRPRTVK